jgi:hypothetical protein
MPIDAPRTCGQIFIPKLGKKIWVHAKREETCEQAKKRVAEKWEVSPEEATQEGAEGSERGSEPTG